MKNHIILVFRLAYLGLTLTRSKTQGHTIAIKYFVYGF